MITRRSLLALAIVPVAGAALAPLASFAGDTASMKIYTKDGVAIRGADPVAYFTENAYVQGDAAHAAEWAGEVWHFSSAENKDKFVADPTAYAPEFGGYCAYAAAKGGLADGDPEAWTIHNGKLYLNFNKTVRTIWLEDTDANIALAEANWPELSKQ